MLMSYFVNFNKLNDHLFGKRLFSRFTASKDEGRMWDLIVSVPDHCLSFFFSFNSSDEKGQCAWPLLSYSH